MDKQAFQKPSIWGSLGFARKDSTVSALEIPDSETSSTLSNVKELMPDGENYAYGYRLMIIMTVMVMAAFMVRSSLTQYFTC